MQKDKVAALKADPGLAAESKDLDSKKKALADDQKAFQQKLDAAITKIDPDAVTFLPPGPAPTATGGSGK